MADIPLSHIFRHKDARKVDRSAVKALASSIAEVGIINPIRVRPARRLVVGEMTDAYECIAGNHRIEAARSLGLDSVPCIVVEDDDLHAELAMIDENLCRADLSAAERSAATARRKAIYLELHPETAQHVAGAEAKHGRASDKLSFAAATASATGKTERTVQRDAERGEKIASDVLAKIKGTHLDKGDYLDTLKKLPPEEQRARVERALERGKPAKRAPSPKNDIETKEDWLIAIMRVWNRGSKEWREEFLERVDQPVMDAA